MNSSKSIYWINALKGLCIVFVFLRHSENYFGFRFGWFDSLYLPFYVNAFFFVSGYLIYWKQLSEPKILEGKGSYLLSGGGKQLFFNILYRIIIPSILFSIIEFVPSCLIQGHRISMGYALYKTVGGGTYWFTSALAVAELIMLLLLCSRNRNVWFYVAVSFVISLLGYLIVRLGVLQNGLWAWRQGMLAMLFFAMGGLYWRYENQMNKILHWWFVLPLLFAYVAMVIAFKGYNNPLISTLHIKPLGFVTSAMACLLLVCLCKRLPEIKQLSFVGQNSLGFYFLSGALPIVLSMIFRKGIVALDCKLTITQEALILIALWLLCLVLAYVAVVVINKWLPWLWDLRRIKKQ